MKRASQRKFHYIYKTHREDGAFYIGMHSTDDLDDGYLGSGTRLTRSIKKHGRDKHRKEILEFLPDRKSLAERERFLINAEMLLNTQCLNLTKGGEGGGFKNAEHQLKANLSPRRNRKEAYEKVKKTLLERNRVFGPKAPTLGFLGKKHSVKSIQQMKASHAGKQAGKNNSQFGTCWVTNGKAIKIPQHQLNEYLTRGFTRGRKLSASCLPLPDPVRQGLIESIVDSQPT